MMGQRCRLWSSIEPTQIKVSCVLGRWHRTTKIHQFLTICMHLFLFRKITLRKMAFVTGNLFKKMFVFNSNRLNETLPLFENTANATLPLFGNK